MRKILNNHANSYLNYLITAISLQRLMGASLSMQEFLVVSSQKMATKKQSYYK